MTDIIQLAANAKTPEDVQGVLNNLKFVRRGPTLKDYQLNSALVTLHNAEGNCYEGVFVAAHLMRMQGFIPRVLFLACEQKEGIIEGHAVFPYHQDGKFFTLGHSGHPDLKSRRIPFDSVENLAKSYAPILIELGYKLTGWAVEELRGNDWAISQTPITKKYLELVNNARYNCIENQKL